MSSRSSPGTVHCRYITLSRTQSLRDRGTITGMCSSTKAEHGAFGLGLSVCLIQQSRKPRVRVMKDFILSSLKMTEHLLAGMMGSPVESGVFACI